MEFKSLNQLKEEFKLNGNDKNELRSELRLKLANLHPDRIGLENYDSEEFMRIQNALNYLNSYSTELVTNEQVTSLIQIVKDLTINNKINTIQEQFNESIDNYYKERKESYIFPKISLSVVTAILTFLWLFPKTIEDHPVLKQYITFENTTTTIIWLALLIYTALFWILISRREQKEKSIAKNLKTERTQNNLLEDFRYSINEEQFSKSEFIDFISNRYGLKNISLFSNFLIGRSGVDEETIENLGNLIIDKASNKKIIEEVDSKKTLDYRYKWK